MRNRFTLAIISLTLLFGALTIVFPSIGLTIVSTLGTLLLSTGILLPFIPGILYGLFAVVLVFKQRLFEIPRVEVQKDLDKQQTASLTLTGFSFTSIGLLLSFFKEEIKRHDSGPQGILFFFALALGCFVASYVILRFRGRRIYSLLADASIDNGIWCILVGLWTFSEETPGLELLPRIFVFFITIYLACIVLHFYYYLRILTPQAATKHPNHNPDC